MAVIVVFMLMPERADSWDPDTHAFIEEHLYKEQGAVGRWASEQQDLRRKCNGLVQ
jgi:hypothetical protein